MPIGILLRVTALAPRLTLKGGRRPSQAWGQALWFGVLMSASSQAQPHEALDSISGC